MDVDVQFSGRLYTCVLVLEVMRILPVALVIVQKFKIRRNSCYFRVTNTKVP